jgi:hypothetical protein
MFPSSVTAASVSALSPSLAKETSATDKNVAKQIAQQMRIFKNPCLFFIVFPF